jgi:hypothetical protein
MRSTVIQLSFCSGWCRSAFRAVGVRVFGLVYGHHSHRVVWCLGLLHVCPSLKSQKIPCLITFRPRAKILARIICADPRLRTYADIGRKAFGPRATLFIGSMFCLEMFAVR